MLSVLFKSQRDGRIKKKINEQQKIPRSRAVTDARFQRMPSGTRKLFPRFRRGIASSRGEKIKNKKRNKQRCPNAQHQKAGDKHLYDTHRQTSTQRQTHTHYKQKRTAKQKLRTTKMRFASAYRKRVPLQKRKKADILLPKKLFCSKKRALPQLGEKKRKRKRADILPKKAFLFKKCSTQGDKYHPDHVKHCTAHSRGAKQTRWNSIRVRQKAKRKKRKPHSHVLARFSIFSTLPSTKENLFF